MLFKYDILRDIERVNKELEMIGESGNISARLNVKGDDEIANMCKVISGMLDKLEKAQINFKKNVFLLLGRLQKLLHMTLGTLFNR